MSRGRYGNVKKPIVDGHRFDSAREANRYGELKLLERAGEIQVLKLQPRFPIEIGGVKVMMSSNQYEKRDRQLIYIADFMYLEETSPGTWEGVIEDVKMQSGHRDKVYLLKRALMEAMGYRIKEV